MKKAHSIKLVFLGLMASSVAMSEELIAEKGEAKQEVAPPEQAQLDLQKVDTLLSRVEKLIQSRSIKINQTEWNWTQLQNFQNQMMRAMAMDPARLDSKYIPEELEPIHLQRELYASLEELQKSRHIASKCGVHEEFDSYIEQCREILELRDKRLYRLARLIAKKGILQESYEALEEGLREKAGASMELSVSWNEDDKEKIQASLQEVASHLQGIRPAQNPAERSLASLTSSPSRMEWVRRLLPVLAILVFATGLLAGLLWRRNHQEH